MQLIRIVFTEYRRAFIIMTVLTLLSGLLGIGVLSYINQFLLQASSNMYSSALWQFAVLVLVYLVASTFAQIKLSQIGHGFIYSMQIRLVKQIMDSHDAQIQLVGKPKILASLSNDIRSLSFAFTRLPELIQGVLFVGVCSIYLVWLSPKIFVVIALFLILMVWVSHFVVCKHYVFFRKMRHAEDGLYHHYETALNGHKELTLNRYRAERFYCEELMPQAEDKRSYHVKADSYHAFALNWGNSIMLAAIGVVFYLAMYHQWATLNEAIIICMTVLFMRGPLTAAIGALPTLMQSQVALNALEQLKLAPQKAHFHDGQYIPAQWQTIRLENISYSYPTQGGQVFSLQPLNLTLKRGETVFLIGANGSGKSTLSMILSGLYTPSNGQIFVDEIEITDENRSAYHQLFASVFTDFHLFEQLMDGMGQDVSERLIHDWLSHLQLSEKVKIEHRRILNTKLSQGQRKRLGLLIAALESRSMLILDEWAADQDPQFRRVFYEQLLPLIKQQGQTIFAISHDDRYFHHAERIISMKQGVLSEYSTQEAVQIADEHSKEA